MSFAKMKSFLGYLNYLNFVFTFILNKGGSYLARRLVFEMAPYYKGISEGPYSQTIIPYKPL